jgi:hypothetical protein
MEGNKKAELTKFTESDPHGSDNLTYFNIYKFDISKSKAEVGRSSLIVDVFGWRVIGQVAREDVLLLLFDEGLHLY